MGKPQQALSGFDYYTVTPKDKKKTNTKIVPSEEWAAWKTKAWKESL